MLSRASLVPIVPSLTIVACLAASCSARRSFLYISHYAALRRWFHHLGYRLDASQRQLVAAKQRSPGYREIVAVYVRFPGRLKGWTWLPEMKQVVSPADRGEAD